MLRSTKPKKARFLTAIARGASVTTAAAHAGVERSTPYQWEKQDSEFAQAWARARTARLTELIDTAYDVAIEGRNVQMLKFLIARDDLRQLRQERTQEQAVQAELVIINPDPAPQPTTHTEEHRHEHHGSFISISKS